MRRRAQGFFLALLGILVLPWQQEPAVTQAATRTAPGNGQCISEPLHSVPDSGAAELEQTGVSPADGDSVSVEAPASMVPQLRKFPYPYKCALAIVPDVDAMSRREFLAIHQFLNTKE